MDQAKTGRLIAVLRKERGLTQQQLGEKLGVTGRTVSRWETGKYMPDLGVLQELAAFLGVSVDTLLSGEKPAMPDVFVPAAGNVSENMSASAFERKEKLRFYQRKWLREHKGYLTFWILLWCAALAVVIGLGKPVLGGFLPLLGLWIYGHIRNRMMIYAEGHVFGNPGSPGK